MDKLKIGFVGGCINNQKSIKRENLYHSVLAKLLEKNNEQIDLEISLATYFSYDRVLQKTENFIADKKPDLIFLFVRPFPLMPLNKLFVKYEKENQQKGWVIHPRLFSRKLIWDQRLTHFYTSIYYPIAPRNPIGLRDINLAGGILFGLHHWALNYITHQIKGVKLLCQQRNIKFTVISPPQNPESLVGNLICKWTTVFLKKYCVENQTGFLNINSLSLLNFESDKIHFNNTGHENVAQLLFNELTLHQSKKGLV